MDPFHGYTQMTRSSSLRTFSEYRAEESENRRRASVSREGVLLEYETLELRVHPPNIVVDNDSKDDCTVLTVDSANRPGTLVEVVQQLTEMGLEIASARISSDGGWFVDVFHVTDHGSKVKSESKIKTLCKMLSINCDADQDVEGQGQTACTVFELVGQDRPGLLADVTQLLTCNGCDVRSAALWTYRNRSAFVMSVLESGQPMKNSTKLTRLHELLVKMMGGKQQRAVVAVKNVVGDIHHDRRLHQRMLEEDLLEWERENKFGSSSLTAGMRQSSQGQEPDQTPDLAAFESSMSECSCESALTNTAVAVDDASTMDSNRVTDVQPQPKPAACSLLPKGYEDTLRSAKYSKPKIKVSYWKHMGYWNVTITCKDRNKLLFDTVCTLADLQYDVYHAAIDSKDGQAFQEYYVRPSNGNSAWDQCRADRMKAMLEVAVERRFPQGLKLHVHSVDRFGLLASLSRVLFENQLSIRRAVVRTHSGNNYSGHSFYVMDASGAPPDRRKVENACHMIGGKLVEAADKNEHIKVGSGEHKFSFSFLNRQWHKEWTGSPGSAASSIGSS